MEIKTIQVVLDENGNEVKEGTMLMFTTTDGSSYTARFNGINKKNNLVFINPMTNEEFPKRPTSIVSTRAVDLSFLEE